jgi:N-acetylglucosaminyldiphosphoundecaprenol N-acetyl-beta-D-mannosaminyltransferase
LSLDGADAAKTEPENRAGQGGFNGPSNRQGNAVEPVWVWGVPLTPVSMREALVAIETLADSGRPSFVLSSNVHYAMLCSESADLRAINERAALILADGAPMVWASRRQGTPLPERVAGSDLIFELCALAARKGYRMFFLGGAEGVAASAAKKLCERYPQLQIVGVESPPFRELSADEQDALIGRIRAARPTILLTAFTMPRGERWIAQNSELTAVPVSMNVGAAFDFVAGRVARAPRWMQKCGLEWAFRLGLEPRRMFGRYARNAWFIVRKIISSQ